MCKWRGNKVELVHEFSYLGFHIELMEAADQRPGRCVAIALNALIAYRARHFEH